MFISHDVCVIIEVVGKKKVEEYEKERERECANVSATNHHHWATNEYTDILMHT